MISGVEKPVFVVGEDSILTAAEIIPDAATDAATAAALSVSIYRRDAFGSGATLLAQLDRGSAGITAWVKFRPKSLAIVADASVSAGDTITVLPTWASSITLFGATLTLHFQKVKPS